MSADPIIYCLQQLTDYRQFERLCSDLMAGSGYTNIDPLGGTADRGRDALHVSRHDPARITIFAYTVRQDWRVKLFEDCQRVRDEGHALHSFVFVCTSSISATQKDDAKEAVRNEFGWGLDLFDLERLRVQLASELRHLVAQHPSIFRPPWFPTRGGLSISESRDTLVIDHVESDHAFATWLARRLQLAGYPTWCFGTAPLAGESADETVRLLIDRRALRYLPVLSVNAVANADFLGRCSVACGTEELSIPCWSGTFDTSLLPNKFRDLTPVRFDSRWSDGLSGLLASLDSQGIRAEVDRDRGRAIALRSYVPEPVTRSSPERVFANVFQATIPSSIIVCELVDELPPKDLAELRKTWAFSAVSPTKLLAFTEPPPTLSLVSSRRLPEFSWADQPTIDGVWSTDVVKELVRRSLEVACYSAGLVWCDNRSVIYFPHTNGPQRNQSFRHVDGRNTWVGVTGERTYGQGERASPFRYQLAPSFRIGFDEDGVWWVTTRIYVRITDCDGIPFEGKAITKRRKSVTKNWWNKEWFARILAVMQALSNGATQIEVGSGIRRLTVNTAPLEWQCPISIDYRAVERIGDFQEEMAAMRFVDEEDEDDDPDELDEEGDELDE